MEALSHANSLTAVIQFGGLTFALSAPGDEFRLGKLCPKGHEWPGSERSLRRNDQQTPSCLGCVGRKKSPWWLRFVVDDLSPLPPGTRLGKLCVGGHRWRGQDATLQRRRPSGTWGCDECERERGARRRADPIEQERQRARVLRYAHSDEGKESRRRGHERRKSDPVRWAAFLKQSKNRKRRQREALAFLGLTCRGTLPQPPPCPEAAGLSRWLRDPKVSKSVAWLVWREQMDYWKAHPDEKRAMRSVQARLNYWSKPHVARAQREKQRRRRADKRKFCHTLKIRDDSLRHRLLRDFGGACAYCGTALTMRTVEIDHFIPCSKGGPHALGNVLPACFSCNRGPSGKWNRDPEEWYRAQPFFTEARWRKILKTLGLRSWQVGQLALI